MVVAMFLSQIAAKHEHGWAPVRPSLTNCIRIWHINCPPAACVRVGSVTNAPQNINVALGVDSQWINGDQVEADDDRWYEVGGSFRIETQPTRVVVYIEGPSACVDILVAGLPIFPVHRKARFRHLKNQTNEAGKRDVIPKVSG